MSLKHGLTLTFADNAAAFAAGKLTPSRYGSTSTNYATSPTHVFDGGALGSLAMRDTGSVDGFSWVAAAAGVLACAGAGQAPAFRALVSADITSLAWSKITGTPTTLAGYGITDLVAVTNAPQTWTSLQTFNGGASITGVMTTSVNNIQTTSTDGSVLQNTTPATLAIPVQLSPRTQWIGTVWTTAAGGASKTIGWFAETLPQTSTTGNGTLRFGCSIGGAAATYPLTINDAGGLVVLQGVTMANGASLTFGNAGYITGNSVTGQFLWRNQAANAGVGIDVATDAVFKVRNRAHSGYATVDALGYSVSGVAGASKAAGPVTSITVVNGIVTAIS